MNKDMINIDDFVREKLGGQTEKEDPAAWLGMKALLDKEMPEKAVPFLFRMRKPITILAAALLIGVLCVGGYELSAIRDKATANEREATLPTPERTTFAEHKTEISAVGTKANAAQDKASGSTAASVTGGNHQAAKNSSLDIRNNSAGLPDTKRTASVTDPEPLGTAFNKGSVNRDKKGTKRSQHKGLSGNDYEALGTSSEKAAQETVAADDLNAGSVKKTAAARSKSLRSSTQSSVFKKGKQSGSQQSRVFAGSTVATGKKHTTTPVEKNKAVNKVAEQQAEKSLVTQKATTAKGKAGIKGEPVIATEKNTGTDSIVAITIVTKQSASKEFPKKITSSVDTVAKVKVIAPVVPEVKAAVINNTVVSIVHPSKKVIKMAAAESRKANKTASRAEAIHQKDVFAANNAFSKEQKESTVKVETIKNKKQKSIVSQWIEGLNLPEAVADAKRDARNAHFYAGFNFGGNYTVSSNKNNFAGVQFGPTGELVFNKHWSLFGAINYFNRSGGKKTVNDNFSRETSDNKVDSMIGANYFFTVRTDSTNRYFNFSTVHSFEMPLTVRYAFNKFYIMTGLNLAYYLPVNVEQVEKQFNQINSHAVAVNSTTKLILAETKPALSATDFGSKFGLGYVIGAGYQFAPAWQADLRLVNSFWDNAKGTGAKGLSKDFYRLPSVQVSVGYQFNRGRNKPTFGPTSMP